MLARASLLTARNLPARINLPRSYSGAFILFNLFSSANHSASSSKSIMSVQEFVDTAIDTHKITVFSKSWCPYCKKTKALFAAEFKDEEPYIIELDERADGDEIQDYLAGKTGQRSVPNVFVNKQHVGGNDDTQAAFKKGELKKLVHL
ncbi:glutaredoxin C4 [Mycena albidolilacea]|uniref:glutathione peroxidase n=1 Tax=Mycena albidolilacea TaxID=1033008 RepID=A0AAD7A8W6_9AGAR|nr:glutaredoxin C4 [Mycena albidolilacea]